MTGFPVKGWCPTAHAPMAAADGLIVRIKPRVGGFTSAQARRIAEAAERHGSGAIELTARANLQVRGLSDETAPAFAQAMVEADLVSAEPPAEARRNILAPPGPGPDLLALGQALERWLEGDQAPDALPPKFGFALAAQAWPAEGDIIVQASPWRVRLGGADLEAETPDPLPALQALTEAFLALRADLDPPVRRMRDLLARIAAEAVFTRASLRPRPAPLPLVRTQPLGPCADGFGLGAPFGAIDSTRLHAAAALADRFGADRISPTPARTLHLTGVEPNPDEELAQAAITAGFLIDPADARLDVHACVGRPGCAHGRSDTRQDALRLAQAWRGPGPLHVSGCAKGCAHPGSATTLVAHEDGQGYDLIPYGHAWTPPLRCGLSLGEALDHLGQEGPVTR